MCPDCVLDLAFIAADINDIRKNGWSWGRGLALGADVLAAAVPFVPAATGAAMRGLGAVERLRYVPSPKHGRAARGSVSAAPVNGQDALDMSLRIKRTSPRRIGVDYDANQFVVFDRTGGAEFHGHVRSWSELTGEMQRTLIDAGIADRRGRIIR